MADNQPEKFDGLPVLYRGTVLPRHCDPRGHMLARYYTAFFDDAGWHILSRAGVSQPKLAGRGLATVAANLTTEFYRPMAAGERFLISGGLCHIGKKSFHHELRLHHADQAQLSAVQRSVEVFFDLDARASAAIPAEFRERLTRHLLPKPRLPDDTVQA